MGQVGYGKSRGAGVVRLAQGMLIVGLVALVVGFVLLFADAIPAGQVSAFTGIGLLVAALLIGLVARARMKKAHTEAMAQVGPLMGFQESDSDPFNLHMLGFPVFDETREASKTLGHSQTAGYSHAAKWGSWNGMEVKLVTYSYSYSTYNSSTSTWSTTAVNRPCAVVTDLPMEFPPLSIGREHLFSRMAGALGGGDIKTGRKEFDRTFRVRSPEVNFAHWLIRDDMAAWLMTLSPSWRFEVAGSAVLCFTPEELTDPRDLAQQVTTFVQVMPREIFTQGTQPAGPPSGT